MQDVSQVDMPQPGAPTRRETPDPPPTMQGVRHEFLRFALLAALFFAVFLGIPYSLRLRNTAWANAQTGFMGGWTGTLVAKDGQLEPLPDRSPSPFVSPQQQQQGLASALRERQQNKESARVIYLNMSLDPYHFASARLRGQARLCDGQGRQSTLTITTLSVESDGAELILDSDTGAGFGNLILRFNRPMLHASTQGFSPEIAGVLTRGDVNAFQQECGRLQAHAAAAQP